MARPRNEEQPYYQKVATIMVREAKSFRQAAIELNLELTAEECAHIEKLQSFQKVLWTARHRFYRELASDPERTKVSLLGQMMFLIQKLTEEGEYDKALEGAMKLAKVEGFIGPDSQVNIFSDVSPKDLEEAKARIAARLDTGGTTTQRPGNA